MALAFTVLQLLVMQLLTATELSKNIHRAELAFPTSIDPELSTWIACCRESMHASDQDLRLDQVVQRFSISEACKSSTATCCDLILRCYLRGLGLPVNPLLNFFSVLLLDPMQWR